MKQSLIYHGGSSGGGGGGFGGGGAPSEVTVTFSSTITIDTGPYFTGSVFHIAATGNFTMAAPLNPTNAKKIIIRILQDATGGRTVTWNAVFRFGVMLPTPVLSVAGNLTDYLAFIYNGAASRWDYIGEVFGL